LNLLLDKISEELPEKPTVIDYLFAGKARSKLTCPSCSNVKNIDEKMYILSLPLPEAEFNYYSVIIVPISSYSIKKIIFKLHKSATIVCFWLCRTIISLLLMKKQEKTIKITIFASLLTIPSKK
jgi:hypothetical protein